jgi:hypothetical protein
MEKPEKKPLYKPQADSVDIDVNIYANESCKNPPNRVCVDYGCIDRFNEVCINRRQGCGCTYNNSVDCSC